MSQDTTDGDSEAVFRYRINDTSDPVARAYVNVRFTDNSNRLWVRIFPGKIEMVDVVSGSTTVVDSNTSAGSTEDVWYTMRIVADDDDVTVYRAEDGGMFEAVLSASGVSNTATNKVLIQVGPGYEFDFDDIRLLCDDLDSSYTYTHNTANELTAMSGPNGSTSYGYDEYGRMTSKDRGTKSATYDYRYGHKLHDVTTDFPGEGDVTYTTGGDGKRRTRTVNSVETWYRWDAGYTVLNEEDDSGNLTRGYVDRNMAHYSSGGSLYEYYFTDHLGSSRALYDGMDDLTATYDYTPYGEHYATQNAAATTHQYTGHDWDPAANLYFAPFRYYGPDMARWMKRDPLGMIDGPNVYTYVRGNPVTRSDPMGLFFPLIILGGGTLALGGGGAAAGGGTVTLGGGALFYGSAILGGIGLGVWCKGRGFDDTTPGTKQPDKKPIPSNEDPRPACEIWCNQLVSAGTLPRWAKWPCIIGCIGVVGIAGPGGIGGV